MNDPLSDNTAALMAAEAAYFTRNRGMSEEAVAELLAVSVPAVRCLLIKASRHPVEYIPTPDEIEAECARFRPSKLIGLQTPHRSPAAILSHIVPAAALFQAGREQDSEAA